MINFIGIGGEGLAGPPTHPSLQKIHHNPEVITKSSQPITKVYKNSAKLQKYLTTQGGTLHFYSPLLQN
jgi:hypothetical protein